MRTEDSYCVRALHKPERRPHRVDKSKRPRAQRLVDEVRDNLRVRVAGQPHALRFELTSQHSVILDDAVVDDGHIPRNVGMSVDFARAAMRRPPGVSDPGPANQRFLAESFLEVRELPGRPGNFDSTPRVNCQAGRVVAPILEPTQPLDEDTCTVSRADVANDAAHVPILLRPPGWTFA